MSHRKCETARQHKVAEAACYRLEKTLMGTDGVHRPLRGSVHPISVLKLTKNEDGGVCHVLFRQSVLLGTVSVVDCEPRHLRVVAVKRFLALVRACKYNLGEGTGGGMGEGGGERRRKRQLLRTN